MSNVVAISCPMVADIWGGVNNELVVMYGMGHIYPSTIDRLNQNILNIVLTNLSAHDNVCGDAAEALSVYPFSIAFRVFIDTVLEQCMATSYAADVAGMLTQALKTVSMVMLFEIQKCGLCNPYHVMGVPHDTRQVGVPGVVSTIFNIELI